MMSRRIFFTLILLSFCNLELALAHPSSRLFLKQADEYFTRAKKDIMAGNLDEAITYLQKAVAINPYFARAHYELARAYAAKGWREKARQSYRRALSMNPQLRGPQETGVSQERELKVPPRQTPWVEKKKKIKKEKTGKEKIREKREMLKEARAWSKELEAEDGMKGMPVIKRTYARIPEFEGAEAEVTYLETSTSDIYSAEERAPTVNTILDPYHPKHKGFKIPYIKDREGLKLTPIVGIRGERMIDDQLVGIESLVQEAQEFNQRTNEQMRKYISLNNKEFHQEQVILHYKESWPKFTYTYLEERTKREYDAKRLWSTNNVFYDDYNRRLYQIDYTIPRIKKLGSLGLKFRYTDNTGFKPNDPASYTKFDSYLFGLETSPCIASSIPLLGHGTFGAKFEFGYVGGDGNFTREGQTGVSDTTWNERNYFLELNFYYPEKYLRITPHFYYEKERHSPSYNTWYVRKNGVKIEKELNGKFKFITDWTYIDYARDKDPFLAGAKHLSASVWTLKNDFEYEFIRDFNLILGLDYGKSLGFDGFDYYTLRTELRLKKPGLTEFRIGYGHTNYFELDDSVDTFLLKIGMFI